jgi:hypothetical protein
LKLNKSVIVIDEQLNDKSFLAAEFGDDKVTIFNDYEETSFAMTN